MKRTVSIILVLGLCLSLCACGSRPEEKSQVTASPEIAEDVQEEETARGDYTIKLYTDTTDEEENEWLVRAASEVGFTLEVVGDSSAADLADRKKDADVLLCSGDSVWQNIINGGCELPLTEWTPSWADKIGEFYYAGRAYGVSLKNLLMVVRIDESHAAPEFQHWSDIPGTGLSYFAPDEKSLCRETTAFSFLFPYADADSPAAGVSTEGWKAFWKFCRGREKTESSSGIEALNNSEVQAAVICSEDLYRSIPETSEDTGDALSYDAVGNRAYNWAAAEFADGSFYTAEYIGIIDKQGRTDEQTKITRDFCDWFGSRDIQIERANAFGQRPCNVEASELCDIIDYANVYGRENMALDKIGGKRYRDYAAQHSEAWSNIIENLGFYRETEEAQSNQPVQQPEEPDWENLDWSVLMKPAA